MLGLTDVVYNMVPRGPKSTSHFRLARGKTNFNILSRVWGEYEKTPRYSRGVFDGVLTWNRTMINSLEGCRTIRCAMRTGEA